MEEDKKIKEQLLSAIVEETTIDVNLFGFLSKGAGHCSD